MDEWIDFKQLREQLDFAQVLSHYGVQMKAAQGGQHKGRCPLPTHPKENTSLTFSANLKRKIWRCFGCNASGNVLDFAVRMEGLNPQNPSDVRKVALRLREQFVNTVANQKRPPQSTPKALQAEPSSSNMRVSDVRNKKELVNAPLDFALKNLSTDHAFFRKRKLLPATIEHFGLGYCTKGMFGGRIVIPLHNLQGQLVGYVGQLPDEIEETEEQPLYLWPNERKREGITHVFDRSKLVYNAREGQEPVTDLVVVQSFESAWWVWQAGFPDVVALMDQIPSLVQAKAMVDMVRKTGRIWFLPNGSKAGERWATELFFDIGTHRFCTWLRLSSGTPTNCSVDEVREMLSWKL